MNRFVHTLELFSFYVSRLQWPAAAGTALAILSAVLYLAVVRGAEEGLARVNMQIAQLGAGKSTGAGQRGTSVEQRLAEFHAFLPSSSTLPNALAAVHAAAQANAMVLASAEYKETVDKENRLLRYQMSLPLRGSYSQIRAWLADVMNGTPNAVLEDLSLRRESAGSDTLDGRARLSLYFRAP